MSNYNSTLQSNNTDLQAILNQINELPEANNGVELPTLTDEGSASDLLSGKQLIDGDGNVVEGTIPTKTSSNLTTSGATVTVPAGYYASQATKSVTTATQATPNVSIDSTGKITATATQTAGYVAAGTKSGTKQLTTQSAKTITPTKSSQTAVAKDVYTTGVVTVAAIPSQYITTTDATAAADEIMSGETAYVNGSKVTGTFSIDSELTTQDSLITQIQNAVNSLPEAVESNPIETCTVTFNSTNSSYSTITFFEYTTLNSEGKIDVVAVTNQDITNSFSIQCVCNTSISGIFPPSATNLIEFTKMNKLLMATAGKVIGWFELTALPNETATITFS